MLRNFSPSANSRKPNTTFTELSQPPDFGKLLSQDGKKANKVNGKAKASEKPNIPTIGLSTWPPADSTKIVPTIGPVQLNETNTSVKAIKIEPTKPPLSALASDLFTSQCGKVISNIPKKEAAKMTKIRKKRILGSQCVLSQLAISGPATTARIDPIKVYIAMIASP